MFFFQYKNRRNRREKFRTPDATIWSYMHSSSLNWITQILGLLDESIRKLLLHEWLTKKQDHIKPAPVVLNWLLIEKRI